MFSRPLHKLPCAVRCIKRAAPSLSSSFPRSSPLATTSCFFSSSASSAPSSSSSSLPHPLPSHTHLPPPLSRTNSTAAAAALATPSSTTTTSDPLIHTHTSASIIPPPTAPIDFTPPPVTSTSSASSSSASTTVTLDLLSMTDAQLASLVHSGTLKFFALEQKLAGDLERAVRVRRLVVEQQTSLSLHALPYEHYNYANVSGQCCENVIGYMPLPIGVAGPVLLNGVQRYLPMATTEGALVASTSRGARAITLSGGCTATIVGDKMCRAPVLSTPDIHTAAQITSYVRSESGYAHLTQLFNGTSRFARLQSIDCYQAGRKLFLRFSGTSGDAMGMNMVGKATEAAIVHLLDTFPSASLLSLSGNVCTDKKPSAINWLAGRGKSVIAECVLKADVIHSVLKTTPERLIEVNYAKNLVGSAVAGSIGGQNCHASNVVTAMFLALGQDPAQNVESSSCLTLVERASPDSDDVHFSVSMPSVEVGTIGGGTTLPAQRAMLDLLGVAGSSTTEPSGTHAKTLASVIAAGVLAGEISLLSALASGHLISSHLRLNRKAQPQPPAGTAPINGASHH